jgi:hypothetical protein
MPSIRLIYAESGEPTSGLEPLTAHYELACGCPDVYHRVLVRSLPKANTRPPWRRPFHCVPTRTNPVAVRSRLSRLLPLLQIAAHCTVLRSRWCQSSVKKLRITHRGASCASVDCLPRSETLYLMFINVVRSVVRCPKHRPLLIWPDTGHGYQWQAQIANLGQHAV